MFNPSRLTFTGMSKLKQDDFSRERPGGFAEAAPGMLSGLGAVAEGTTTMRRLSEPLQRQAGDFDPTSQPPPMDIETLMQMIRDQMTEGKEAAEAQEGSPEHEAEEDAAETMFIESILETNPEAVLKALMKFISRRGSSQE
jgi:hypothetical protein